MMRSGAVSVASSLSCSPLSASACAASAMEASTSPSSATRSDCSTSPAAGHRGPAGVSASDAKRLAKANSADLHLCGRGDAALLPGR